MAAPASRAERRGARRGVTHAISTPVREAPVAAETERRWSGDALLAFAASHRGSKEVRSKTEATVSNQIRPQIEIFIIRGRKPARLHMTDSVCDELRLDMELPIACANRAENTKRIYGASEQQRRQRGRIEVHGWQIRIDSPCGLILLPPTRPIAVRF